MKERIDKLGFLKINEVSVKAKRMKKVTDGEEIFAKHASDKGLLSNIYKEPFTLSNNETSNPILKIGKDLNIHLAKEDTQMADSHMKRCFTSYVQVKATMRHHHVPIRMADIQNTDSTKY